MEHIKDILPSAIQQLTKNKVEYYKRQANHYAKLYIKNGNKRYCNDLRRYIKIMSNAKYSEILGIYCDL